jgi:hypothetical protein
MVGPVGVGAENWPGVRGCILYLTGSVGKGCIKLAQCGRVCITGPGLGGCP